MKLARPLLLTAFVVGLGLAAAACSRASSAPSALAPPVVPGAPAPAAGAAPATQGGFMLSLDGSEARYRARETFVNIPTPNEAVGRTSNVAGGVRLDPTGEVVPDQSRVVVDVSTLESDQALRDEYLRRETLLTNQYPTVTFVAREIHGLPSPLSTSGAVQFQIAGDLTIRDVTRPVVWGVAANVDGQNVNGTARYEFHFGEWNIPVPRVARVASIAEPILLEIAFGGSNRAN